MQTSNQWKWERELRRIYDRLPEYLKPQIPEPRHLNHHCGRIQGRNAIS
jgi:hypothetical protein